jgi:hypothetical protein
MLVLHRPVEVAAESSHSLSGFKLFAGQNQWGQTHLIFTFDFGG